MAHQVIHGDETNSVAVRAITDIAGTAGGFASVASDPTETSASHPTPPVPKPLLRASLTSCNIWGRQ